MKKIIYRAVKIALIIGTILLFINHYQLFLGAELKEYELIQIALTYFVPFGVSFYSARCEVQDNSASENSNQSLY